MEKGETYYFSFFQKIKGGKTPEENEKMKSEKVKKRLSLLLTAVMVISALAACNKKTNQSENNSAGGTVIDETNLKEDDRNLTPYEYTKLNISATDDYNRTFGRSNGKKTDKARYVGMFFYLTLGYHNNHDGIYDVSKITDYGEHLENFQGNTPESPVGSAHFWGEPVWGYYQSSDPWVIRRQVEMLTMAGIDFFALDCTNAVTYDETVTTLLDILEEYRRQGWDVPKVMFYCNSSSRETITHLYTTFYKNNKYSALWFAPEGKPVITKEQSLEWDTENAVEQEISEYFHFKLSQWPTEANKPEGVPWIDFSYPQYNHNGWMSVSPAQHAVTVLMSDTVKNWGRGYDFDAKMNDSEHFREGINYQQQWNTVLDDKEVDYVFITQWNEWVAEKGYYSDLDKYWMCDNFNEEYSRDLEPCKNGYGDNFYLQTIQNIRRYAYEDEVQYRNPSVTIDVSDFDEKQWEGVKSVYKDFAKEAIERNWLAFDSSFSYMDTSNRNDIVTTKVCRDEEYVYFRIETVAPVTEYKEGDKKWMNILIRTENGGDDSLLGYQYVLNRKVEGNSTWVYKSKGGNSYRQVGTGDVYVKDNVMQVRVKLSDLGLNGNEYYMEFKVCDNITNQSDILSYYNSGDAAPIGRLSYVFGNKKS